MLSEVGVTTCHRYLHKEVDEMRGKLVDVVFHVERQGDSYYGYVVLNGVRYDYEFRSLLPFDLLMQIDFRRIHEIRRYVHLALSKNKWPIVLDNREFDLFYTLILARLLEFNVRVGGRARINRMVNSFIRSVGGKASPGEPPTTETICGRIRFPRARLEVLQADKFGWIVPS